MKCALLISIPFVFYQNFIFYYIFCLFPFYICIYELVTQLSDHLQFSNCKCKSIFIIYDILLSFHIISSVLLILSSSHYISYRALLILLYHVVSLPLFFISMYLSCLLTLSLSLSFPLTHTQALFSTLIPSLSFNQHNYSYVTYQ